MEDGKLGVRLGFVSESLSLRPKLGLGLEGSREEHRQDRAGLETGGG